MTVTAQLDLTSDSLAPRVLILDNDAETRAFIMGNLALCGFSVAGADSCEEALEKIPLLGTQAVILDQELSREDRDAFLARLRAMGDKEPLLIVLTSPCLVTREQAYGWGAAVVMCKPMDPQHLASRIRELLVPARLRWARRIESAGGLRKVSIRVDKLELGRGGARVPAPSSAVEGERVEFDIEINSEIPKKIHGIGVVRYVKGINGRQQAWGLEFDRLDVESVAVVDGLGRDGQPVAFIPGDFHA